MRGDGILPISEVDHVGFLAVDVPLVRELRQTVISTIRDVAIDILLGRFLVRWRRVDVLHAAKNHGFFGVGGHCAKAEEDQ